MLNRVRENCAISEPYTYEIRIATFNNFPTACGLTSSASGLACMAKCIAAAFNYKGDVSELVRLGSGSASRSCFGGFFKWNSDATFNSVHYYMQI
jgi:mevalonate pyrophosphate decarboxylase